MRHVLMAAIVLSLLLSGCEQQKQAPLATTSPDTSKIKVEEDSSDALQKKLTRLRHQYDGCGSVACCESYVARVIVEGSDVLDLPTGAMDQGLATPGDAKKIAAYVMTLSGKDPTHPEHIQEGNLYYNGNCGGCHGDDGKGLNGIYPDLTLPLLKGAVLYKERLGKEIEELKTRLQKQ